MLLVIDVGNTNMVFGLYEEDILKKSFRMTTVEGKTSDEIGVFMSSFMLHNSIEISAITDIIIASVVPNIMYSLTNAIRKYFGLVPMLVSPELNLGNTLNLVGNRGLGADRIVNCVAAYTLLGGPVIIIDYGTATTYDAVDSNGAFVTGITAPGIKISADALATRAALLGKVELLLPKSVLVTSTTESMQAGILFGRIGETEYIVSRIKKEMDAPDAKVVATGGLAHTVASGTDIFDCILPSLTLDGLRLIFNMNR